MKEVLNNLKIINHTDKIIVGVSGGEDSMCLLHLLINHLPKENIIVAHVNHNIRSESASDLEFVKKYSLKNDVKFESTVLPNDKNYNESELRNMRYDFFKSIMHKYKATYLLTAHHGDDLIETILMRLTRGSSLKGYAGIELLSIKDDYKILRPLLSVSKEQIKDYIKKNNINYVYDNTNDTDEYTRNRYRHHVIFFLKEENNKVHEKYLSFSKELLEYNELIDNLVIKDIKKNGYPNYNLEGFAEKEPLLQRKIIEKILHYTYKDNINHLNKKHVSKILEIITKPGNSEIHLPLNKKLIKEYNNISIIENNNHNYIIDEIFNNYYETEYYVLETLKNSLDKSNYTLKLLSTDLSLPLHIRTIKDGDKMAVKNLKGYKKVKQILIDSKIPKSKREHLIVMTDNNDKILWLPSVKKSEFDKSKEEKYDIIIKYSEKNLKEK